MDQKAFLITSKSISELFARSKRKPTDPSRPEPARSDSGQEKLPNSQADTDFGGSCLLSPDRLKRKYKKKKKWWERYDTTYYFSSRIVLLPSKLGRKGRANFLCCCVFFCVIKIQLCLNHCCHHRLLIEMEAEVAWILHWRVHPLSPIPSQSAVAANLYNYDPKEATQDFNALDLRDSQAESFSFGTVTEFLLQCGGTLKKQGANLEQSMIWMTPPHRAASPGTQDSQLGTCWLPMNNSWNQKLINWTVAFNKIIAKKKNKRENIVFRWVLLRCCTRCLIATHFRSLWDLKYMHNCFLTFLSFLENFIFVSYM